VSGHKYLHLGQNIDTSSYIITEFYVESDLDILDVAEALAAESSIGTWTELTTMKGDIINRLGARVFYANKDERIIKIAYPIGLFEEGNLPQLLSDVAGNVFGLKEIKNLRVRDIRFPESYVRMFDGPAYGINGIRKIMEIEDRPLLGTIIKPKVGLSPDEHAKVAFDAWVGGVDVVKDDENLSDQNFNPFEPRILKTLMMRKKAEDITGQKKVYVANITGKVRDMEERAKFVKVQGGRVAMMDIVTAGFSGVQHIRDQNYGLILHGHRAMHGAFTHSPKHGIAMLPLAKIARLAGIDQLHTGTVIGKMRGGAEEVGEINHCMRRKWHDIKSTLPIASGGVHPGLVPEMIRLIGKDVIINMGGGIHGHPDGIRSGAKAARQAVRAALKGVELREYSKDNSELAQALKKWGNYKGKKRKNPIVTYQYEI
jgi:ribulose-bisphosphate carboxylase large chain